MAIAEDASAPASVHTASGSGVLFITTASFTPAANSTLVAFAECGNNTGSGAMTCPVTDSLGSTWTLLKRASAGNGGSAEVWALDAGASPAARTVTATGTGGTQATGVSLTVKVLTGALPAATILGASATALNTTAYGIAITPLTLNSLVAGGLVDVITGTGALTVNGITTDWQSFLDTGSTEKYAEFRATALTAVTGSPITIGYSTTAGDGQNLVAVELKPAADAAAGPRAFIPLLGKVPRAMSPLELFRNITLGDRTVSGVTAVALADVSAATADDMSIAAAVPLADTGSGTEALAIAAAVPLADPRAGTDALSIAAAVPLPDTATGADTLAVGTGSNPSLPDAATATDTLTISVAVGLADPRTVADALAVNTGLVVPLTVTGSDRPTATVTARDTGSGVTGTDMASASVTSSDRSSSTVTGQDQPTSTVSST